MYPVFLKSIGPVFLGRDARDLEQLLWDVYRHASNYKLQGIALWVGVAAIEMGLLELLARTAEKPIADFFGGSKRRDIPVYFASGNRGNTPEAEIEHLQKLVAGSGVKALKFRLGGRMSRTSDGGRTWQSLPAPAPMMVAGIADAGNGQLAVVGMRGVVIAPAPAR